MAQRTVNFARVLALPAGAELLESEIDAVLEIAYAMATANGHASFDELESFRALATYLKPGAGVSEILDALAAAFDASESMEHQVRGAASRLSRTVAQDAAYKAAYTVAVFDLETNEDERELDDLLIEVLALDGRVDALEVAVNEALVE
ncbi:hypothetical protein BH09MYX1_BH09MYX1_15010 [soil metagenome]